MPQSLSSIVVTGYGCISAAGHNAEIAAANIRAGLVANEMVGGDYFPASFTAPCFLVKGDELRPFPRILESGERCYNRMILLALSAIEEALLQAGLAIGELRDKRVGVALGTTVGCTFHNEEYFKVWKAGEDPEPAPLFTYLSSNIAEAVQKFLRIKGPRVVITNACASGTDAIGVAKSWLQYGLCDIAIAGGVDELSRIACYGFKSLMLVAGENCRPFDAERKGLNLGEGSGVVVLETEGAALARHGEIKGWIRGYGAGGDAHHPTAPDPLGRGLQLAVTKALIDGGVSIENISMINGHGTGTLANDRAETNALAALGFVSGRLPVVSTKGATGHTLGAAGGVEAVFTLMALNRGEVTGTIGCLQPDPQLDFEILPQSGSAVLAGRVGISQSLAFGGGNGALVIEGAGP